MPPLIYIDLRCLQDPAYQVRGIGHHVASLLRTRTGTECAGWKTIGLIDTDRPALPQVYSSLVDELSASLNPASGRTPAVFVDGTPMTHDPRFTARFVSHSSFFKAAAVYDFIPLEWPGYLPTTPIRIEYMAKMARLRRFDFFLPLSEYTAWRLQSLLGVSRTKMHVTGACVRSGLFELNEAAARVAPPKMEDLYFLTFAAADIRKNADVVVKALRHLNLLHSNVRPIRLKVAGHDYEAYKAHLLALAGHSEGNGFLEFCPDISDESLVTYYRGAVATIVPSHIEGFSLPVVEAALCGSPAIVSSCAAHLELVDRPQAVFPSTDYIALSEKLDSLLSDSHLRSELLASQAHLPAKFHEREVGKRFWTAIHQVFPQSQCAASVVLGKKPKLAFLSPFPPEQSGVARYTALTLQAGSQLFTSNLYTDAPRPLTCEGFYKDAGQVSMAPVVSGSYDAIVSVLGDSRFHVSTFEIFERFGGPCILHDASLFNIYLNRLGPERFSALTGKLLGRSVTAHDIQTWIQERSGPLLLEPVLERASPLIVHTPTQQAEIKKRYGVEVELAACCPTVFFDAQELTPASKALARKRQGIPDNVFAISSFGIVAADKAPDIAILALDLLRHWKIPAKLYLVGNAKTCRSDLESLAEFYGTGEHVIYLDEFVDEATYRDFLIATDAAVQLRTYGSGQFSASLADCISAGVSTVANTNLAASCESPSYVSTVPDRFSPLHVAEQLALICESKNDRSSFRQQRAEYLETHNFVHYGKTLLNILLGAE